MPKDEEVKKKIESPFDWFNIKYEDIIFGAKNKMITLQFEKISTEGK
jgi:hypothetical protein